MEQLEDLDPVVAILVKNVQFAAGELFSGPEPVTSTSDCGSHIFKWKPATLAILFNGQKKPPSWLSPTKIDVKLALMQALAEVEEDKWPDDGEIEIPSDEEYNTMSPNFLIFILFIITKM